MDGDHPVDDERWSALVAGVITGRDSAAERDVLVTARRRWPAVRFEMHNCAVQGPTAAASVATAIGLVYVRPQIMQMVAILISPSSR